jgi:uncharacterized membrane protein
MKTSAGVRVAIGAGLGVVGGLIVSAFWIWQVAILIGWDLAVATLISWIWLALYNLSPEQTERNANREDPSLRLSELIVLTAGVAVLAAVGLLLIRAGNATGGTKAYLIALGVLSVALVMVPGAHRVHPALRPCLLRPACRRHRLQRERSPDVPRLRLPGRDHRDDVPGVRHQPDLKGDTADRTHPRALSYLFGAVIVGLVINVVSSLLH